VKPIHYFGKYPPCFFHLLFHVKRTMLVEQCTGTEYSCYIILIIRLGMAAVHVFFSYRERKIQQ
jgi:hypothetical protein